MIKIENVVTPSPEQWEAIIMGTRNPVNSWDRSDTMIYEHELEDWPHERVKTFNGLGDNDYDLMMRLSKGGPVHAKYRRMVMVYVTITAPLYWWKEFDTYKVGTVVNSCSTMHKIAAKEFMLEDFSCEHLNDEPHHREWIESAMVDEDITSLHKVWATPLDILRYTIEMLNTYRLQYLETKNENDWWQMIQLLPSSYNQRRTVMLNYEVLANIYKARKNHKLDEWRMFCEWIEGLSYSELITGKEKED